MIQPLRLKAKVIRISLLYAKQFISRFKMRPEKTFNIRGSFLTGIFLVIASLVPCHLLFSFYMHGFNTSIAETAGYALNSGFLILPGPATCPSPSSWLTASGSALFFTLTTGALFFSTGDIFACFLSGRFSSLKTRISILALVVLILSFFMVFAGVPWVFQVTFFVASMIAGLIRFLFFKGHKLRSRLGFIMGFSAFIILAMVSIQGSGLFSGIRDRLLFGTSTGEAVIDFYYKYNLYAAEVIKKPEQRMVKAIKAVEIENISSFEAIRPYFEKKGFVFLQGKENGTSYSLSLENENLIILNDQKLLISIPVKSFISDPPAFFRVFFSKADKVWLLRSMVFASFCFGIPLIFVGLIADIFLPVLTGISRKKIFIVFGIIIFVAIALMYSRSNSVYDNKQLENMLNSLDHEKRIEAMGFVIRKKIDPDSFILPDISPGYGSPRERILYLYLASRSGGLKRFEVISGFVNDPYPYVACQAIRFLSQLGDKRSEPVFEGILRNHPNLYVQFTALEALKTWKNRKNK